FSPVGSSKLQRIQGAYIDEGQVLELTEAWRRQGQPEFREELLEEAIFLVASMQTASTSMLQRRLRLGYTRAGRLIDLLERRGIISGYEGSKPRQVLVAEADVPRILAHLAEGSGAGGAAVEHTPPAPSGPSAPESSPPPSAPLEPGEPSH
ncbi:MAG: DNA translocase FtsK, partial [Solirubrobacteraceae bacterium]